MKRKKRPEKVAFLFQIQKKQLEELRDLSRKTDRSIAQHLRIAIAQYLGMQSGK
jgi:hypothetical protein